MITKSDLAFVRSGDVARDAKSESRSAGLAAPRAFESNERFENPFQLSVRYAGTVVANVEDQFGRAFVDTDFCALAIDRGVVD